MAPRKKRPTPRKAAKPPVLNLKASEVKTPPEKPAKKTAADTSKVTGQGKPAQTGKPAAKASQTTTPKVGKPATEAKNSDAGKTAQKSPSPKPETAKPKKKSSRAGAFVLTGLVVLAAAGLGGAWVYKEYGSRFFAPPPGPGAAKLTAALARIEGLEKQLAETRKAIPAVPDTTALTKQTGDNAATIAALQGEVKKLRAALAKPANGNADAAQAATKLALEDLGSKVSALETKLSDLPTQSAKPDTAALEALKTQLQQAVARLNTFEQQLSGLREQAAQLAEKQQKLAVNTASQSALALARNFTALRAKVNAGTAYEEALDALAPLVANQPALDVLRPFAKTGAPTLASLGAALKAAPTSTPQPVEKNADTADKGFIGGFTKRLSGLVKVTKIDARDWNLARKQALGALQNRGIQAAIDTLSGGADTLPPALLAWKKQAFKKLAIDGALQKLSILVMAELSAKTN